MLIEGEAVSAAILSGGAARRAGGVNKSFLRHEGRVIIELQLERLRPVFGDRIFVITDRPDDYAGLGLSRIGDVPVAGLAERASLRGLYSALVHSPTPWVFALACDMPLPDPKAALAGWSAASAVCGAAPRGFCLQGARGPESFHALYHRDLAGRLRERLKRAHSRSDLSVRAWIADEPRIAIGEPSDCGRADFARFTNINQNEEDLCGLELAAGAAPRCLS